MQPTIWKSCTAITTVSFMQCFIYLWDRSQIWVNSCHDSLKFSNIKILSDFVKWWQMTQWFKEVDKTLTVWKMLFKIIVKLYNVYEMSLVFVIVTTVNGMEHPIKDLYKLNCTLKWIIICCLYGNYYSLSRGQY